MSLSGTQFRPITCGLLIVLQVLPGCAMMSRSWPNSGRQMFRQNYAVNRYAGDSELFVQEVSGGDTSGRSALRLVSSTDELLPLTELTEDNAWSVSLLETIHLALQNSEVILIDSQFLSPFSSLLNTPDLVASVYDPAIQQTEVAGNRGAAAAASDFIPLLSARSTYGEEDVIQNNRISAGLFPGSVLNTDTGNVELRLEQQLATGGRVSLRNNTVLTDNNVMSNLFPGVYQGQLALEFNQPLWGGAGPLFTDIAGPIELISTRTPSVDQGILISRINEDLSQNDFQTALRQLVKDVADVYQDLNLAYRRYQIESQARDDAEIIWKRVQAKFDVGVGEGLAAEAQAAENYYAAEARARDTLANVRLTENRLRRLLGLGPGNGIVIRPTDEPKPDSFDEDWRESLQIAFARRPELNETILRIQSLEMQMFASRSLCRPRLDLVSNIHVNGFGDRLLNQSAPPAIPPPFTGRPDSYYENLLGAEQTGWFAGLQLSIPLDWQLYQTLRHQLEYRLAKTRAALKAQKKEISHELWHAFCSAERWSELVSRNKQRVEAARRQVRALDAAFPTARVSVDLLVRAKTTLALAETEYARAISEYNKAMSEVRFRRGTLLEDLHIAVRDQGSGLPPENG